MSSKNQDLSILNDQEYLKANDSSKASLKPEEVKFIETKRMKKNPPEIVVEEES